MFTLKIVTPTQEYKTLELDRISLPSTDGTVTVLSNHMDIMVPLEFGLITTIKDKVKTKYVISEGLFTFSKNEATLLVTSIESADELDVERAQRSKERAEERLSKKASTDDLKRAEYSLKRALIRLSLNDK